MAINKMKCGQFPSVLLIVELSYVMNLTMYALGNVYMAVMHLVWCLSSYFY